MARRRTVVACIFARTDSAACLRFIERLQASPRQLPRQRADIAGHVLLASKSRGLSAAPALILLPSPSTPSPCERATRSAGLFAVAATAQSHARPSSRSGFSRDRECTARCDRHSNVHTAPYSSCCASCLIARRHTAVACILARTGSVACLARFECLQASHRQLLRLRAHVSRHFLLASERTGLLRSCGHLHLIVRRHTAVACILARTGRVACMAHFGWYLASHHSF